MSSRKFKLDAEVAQQKRQDALDTLTQGIEQLLESGNWQKYLQTQARFYRYSFNNCCLIMTQRRDASQVAGFQTWKQLGRHVKKVNGVFSSSRRWSAHMRHKPKMATPRLSAHSLVFGLFQFLTLLKPKVNHCRKLLADFRATIKGYLAYLKPLLLIREFQLTSQKSRLTAFADTPRKSRLK